VTNRINLLISDGRKLVREGISALLERHEQIYVVGDADDTKAAIKLVGALAAQVVVLNLPPTASITEGSVATKLVRELLAEHPQLRIIVLTINIKPHEAREVLAAGAAGCLTRECACDELVAAIRAVADGQMYLSRSLTQQVVSGFVASAIARPRSSARQLAPREIEILRRIASGESTKEIAYALHVGTKTIETHRRRIMEKLNRHSVAELTQYAIVHGLISVAQSIES
jgi:DNA-binding NarL/FixJ family response regulator